MVGKVTRKSPYGFQIEGKEGWVNYGKFYKGNKEFSVEDVVEVELQGNFLKSLKVTSTSQPVAKAKCPSCGFEF